MIYPSLVPRPITELRERAWYTLSAHVRDEDPAFYIKLAATVYHNIQPVLESVLL